MIGEPLSSADALMAAALRLAAANNPTFSAEVLIVEAWKANPEKFGIRGFEEYPDTHRAMSYLCGSRGLVGRALLCRVKRRYGLTTKGRKYAELLAAWPRRLQDAPGRNGKADGHLPGPHALDGLAPPGIAGKPASLAPDQDALVKRLLDSPCRQREIRQLNFADAAKWWGISNDDPDAAEAVSDALANLFDSHVGLILSDRREVARDELVSLVQLDAALRDRFSSHLKLLSNRSKA